MIQRKSMVIAPGCPNSDLCGGINHVSKKVTIYLTGEKQKRRPRKEYDDAEVSFCRVCVLLTCKCPTSITDVEWDWDKNHNPKESVKI